MRCVARVSGFLPFFFFFFVGRDGDSRGKAPRIARGCFPPQRKLDIFDKKAWPSSTTAAAPGHLDPPEAAQTCLTAPAVGENKVEVLTIKTLAALSSCVITSGAPTAAIIVPLQ